MSFTLLLIRVMLPAALLMGIVLRPFGLSLFYLLVFLLLPLVETPDKLTFPGFRGKFFLLPILLSFLLLGVHTAWHVTLAAFTPYGSLLTTFPLLEKIGLNLGLVSYREINTIMGIHYLAPELVVFSASLGIYSLMNKISQGQTSSDVAAHEKNRKYQQYPFITNVGKYLCLFLLMLAGCVLPSITSSIYFLVFMGTATAWSLGADIGRGFAVVARGVLVVMAAHMIFLLVYQCTWLQDLYDQNEPFARYFGMKLLVNVTGPDYQSFRYEPTLERKWLTMANPVMVLITYYILAIESRELLKSKPEQKSQTLGLEDGQPNGALGRGFSFHLPEPARDKWMAATRRVRVAFSQNSKTLRGNPEYMPLISNLTSKKLSSTRNVLPLRQDSTGSVLIDHESLHQSMEKTPLENFVAGLSDFGQLLIRSSYIATTIVMMAWSIMYHSWLTFVFLMWACIVWLCSNQRTVMLKSSPVLVVYAMILLLVQYVFSMDITDEEFHYNVESLHQVGVSRPVGIPAVTLTIKAMFTCVFWLTLRQHAVEVRQKRQDAAAADVAAPLRVVSTAETGMEERRGGEETWLNVVGKYVNALCARYWIYVVVIMLFIIGLTGQRMSIFRIIYMFLFLAFILMFQISWKWWRKSIYVFWITVIVYSMINLILLYVYQFDNFSKLLEDYLHIDKKLQNDLGLEPYDPADLFLKLLTPTLFLISTILQVHYFHKDFMALSDPNTSFRTSAPQDSDSSSRQSPAGTSTMKDLPPLQSEEAKLPALSSEEAKSPPLSLDEVKLARTRQDLVDDSTSAGVSSIKYRRRQSKRLTTTSETQSLTFRSWLLKNFYYYRVIVHNWINKLYMFLDLHLVKIIMFSLMLLCVSEVCAMHTPIIFLISPALLLHKKTQRIIILFISVLISVYFMARMVYQIDYIKHENFDVNCSETIATMFQEPTTTTTTTPEPEPPTKFNNAEWVGFVKKSVCKPLVAVVKGYIGVMCLITFWSIVRYRQRNIRQHGLLEAGTDKIMFPGIKRKDADTNLINCIKFFINYGFYKFGVEITLISLITTIGSRMDVYAVIYSGWLFLLVSVNRQKQAQLWRPFTIFIMVAVPVQYMLSVGILPQFCPQYPWNSSTQQMKHVRKWFFLPHMVERPNAAKLIFDYIVLMFATRQLRVFRVERRHKDDYPGGSNAQELDANWETPEFVNPVPDFLGTINTWLDFFKRVIFMSMLWVTLAIMFLTGTNRVNLFSIGYLIGSFIFLWQGTDFYLLPKAAILRWWSYLLFYNVSVVSLKTLLQIPGCIFGEDMQAHACWLVQLLGIGCVDKFAGGNLARFIRMNYVKYSSCSVPQEDIGLAWDGVCFAFLLVQRRLFHSYYFYRIIDEAKATTILASRGAELIEELRQKQMVIQEDQEQKILEKIKLKMERIKANQKRIHGALVKEPLHHDEEDDDTQNMDTSVGGGAPAGFHTPESAASPRGFHTPLSDRSPESGSPERGPSPEPISVAQPDPAPAPPAAAVPAPPGGPPSPSSALMTASLSLDAYLEPRRISFSSPPASDLVCRAQSPEDSYPVFSPPPIRRASLAPSALRRGSASLISQLQSQSKSHRNSIHSGDYYMFDDEFDDTEVQIDREVSASKLDKDTPKEMGFGTLLATAFKTDLRRAVSARKFSKDHSEGQPTQSSQQPRYPEEGPSEGTQSELKDPELIHKVSRIRETVVAVISSILISITKYMMKFSRDYRYVSNTLSVEKRVIKEKPGFGIGVRGGPQMRWEPLPEAFRKLSEISVPEIRILAPSMERGLDDSPAPRRHTPSLHIPIDDDDDGTSEHESAFSLQSTSSHDVSVLEDQDDSVFKRGNNPLVHFANAVWYAILSHTEIVCYLMVFINQIQSATILSIPLPLMVFIWGSLSIPRPTKTFWVTLIAYTEVIVLIKSMFQFEMLPWNQKAIPENMPFSAPRVIGIERKPSYAVYDLLLLLFIFFHRYMLKSLGLWKESVPEMELRADSEYPMTYEDTKMLVEGKAEDVGKKYIKLHDANGPHHPMIDRLYYVRAAMEQVARELGTRWSDPRVAILVHQQLTSNRHFLDRFKREEAEEKSRMRLSSRHSTNVSEDTARSHRAGTPPLEGGASQQGPTMTHQGSRVFRQEPGASLQGPVASPPRDGASSQEGTPASHRAGAPPQESGPAAQGSADVERGGAPGQGSASGSAAPPNTATSSHTNIGRTNEKANIYSDDEKPEDDHYEVYDDEEPIIAITSTLEGVYTNYPGVIVLSAKRYLFPMRQFFRRMLQPGSRVKVDVYAYMFMCDFINFLVVIFGFAAFGTHQGDGGVQAYLEENKVPIPFLVMLILQFILIVIDRALYLRKYMLGKILFQYALIIGIHIWMFFVLPFITERAFNVMAAPPTWYVVKCIYLLLSAYQIRSGYPRRIIGNFLCKSYSLINQILFRGFMAVPFVFELRTLMDWIWTDTSMTLMDWLKMEDIFASVYLLKCSRYIEDEFPQPRGQKKSAVSKYVLGGGVLAFVIAIIWFPLVFFAFGNTVGQPNPPTDVTAKIRIGPFLPVYMMSAQSHNIALYTESDYNQLVNLYSRDRTAQTFLSNYMYNDVAVVSFSSYSTSKWGISPPELERLEKETNSSTPIMIKFTFVVTHKTNAQQNPPVFEESREVALEGEFANGTRNPDRDKLYQLLTGTAPPDTWVEIPVIFPKFVKVFNKGSAKPAYQLSQEGEDGSDVRYYRGILLRLERQKDDLFWRVRESCDNKEIVKSIPLNDCDMLVMYTFNDKLFPDTLNFISGSGIIGLYTTFVFLASRVIRSFFSGIYTRIMFDDLPNVDRVLQLCLDIYLVREALELTLEEDLFAKLVFLYRSPETMIKWSRPKEEQPVAPRPPSRGSPRPSAHSPVPRRHPR